MKVLLPVKQLSELCSSLNHQFQLNLVVCYWCLSSVLLLEYCPSKEEAQGWWRNSKSSKETKSEVISLSSHQKKCSDQSKEEQ